MLLWGDETAVPAASAILESLPAGQRARVWLEVRDAGDIQDLATDADAEITWLVGEEKGRELFHGPRRPSPLTAERPRAGKGACDRGK